jgi:hypothetical protein
MRPSSVVENGGHNKEKAENGGTGLTESSVISERLESV